MVSTELGFLANGWLSNKECAAASLGCVRKQHNSIDVKLLSVREDEIIFQRIKAALNTSWSQ